MQVNMKPILNGEVNAIELDYMFDIPQDAVWDDVVFTHSAHVTGIITNSVGFMSLKLCAEVPYSAHCARCLDDVEGTIIINFEKNIVVSGTLENEDTDDYLFITDGVLQLDVPLAEQIIMDFPLRFLCSEDCRGLCSKCGKNLNDGDCDCPKREIDPRLEILAKLLKKDDSNPIE